MNPSLKLVSDEIKLFLDAINSRFDEFEARLDRRFSPPTKEQDAQFDTPVFADNWGGQFDAPVIADNWGGQFDAPVIADNWGGLFEQPAHDSGDRDLSVCAVDVFGDQIRNEHGLTSNSPGALLGKEQLAVDAATTEATSTDQSGSEIFGFDTAPPYISSALVTPTPAPSSAPAPTLPPPTSPSVILGSIPCVARIEGADRSLALAAVLQMSRLADSPRILPDRPKPWNFPFVLATDPSGLLLRSAILDAATGSTLRFPNLDPKELTQDDAKHDSSFPTLRYCADHIFPKLDSEADHAAEQSTKWDQLVLSRNGWDAAPVVFDELPSELLARCSTLNVSPAANTSSHTAVAVLLEVPKHVQRLPLVVFAIPNKQSSTSVPARLVFEEMPSRQHGPWPPPTELWLVNYDAGLRPLPWPSFNMVESCSVSCCCGHLWKPPWFSFRYYQAVQKKHEKVIAGFLILGGFKFHLFNPCFFVIFLNLMDPKLGYRWTAMACLSPYSPGYSHGYVLEGQLSYLLRPSDNTHRSRFNEKAQWPFVTITSLSLLPKPLWPPQAPSASSTHIQVPKCMWMMLFGQQCIIVVDLLAAWDGTNSIQLCFYIPIVLLWPDFLQENLQCGVCLALALINVNEDYFQAGCLFADPVIYMLLCGDERLHRVLLDCYTSRELGKNADVRPLPWPSFTLSNCCFMSPVVCWKPPWPLQPRQDMINTHAVGAEVYAIYLTKRESMLKQVGNIPGRINLTVQSWAPSQTLGYISLARQFIDTEWKLHRRMLHLVMVPWSCSEHIVTRAISRSLPWPPPHNTWIWFQLSANCVLSCPVSKLQLTIFHYVSCWESIHCSAYVQHFCQELIYLGSYTRGHVTVLPVLSRGKGFKFRMLNEDEPDGTVLLVFATKPDLPNAMNAAEISDQLGLHSLCLRHWYIKNTCAPAVYFYGLAILVPQCITIQRQEHFAANEHAKAGISHSKWQHARDCAVEKCS